MEWWREKHRAQVWFCWFLLLHDRSRFALVYFYIQSHYNILERRTGSTIVLIGSWPSGDLHSKSTPVQRRTDRSIEKLQILYGEQQTKHQKKLFAVTAPKKVSLTSVLNVYYKLHKGPAVGEQTNMNLSSYSFPFWAIYINVDKICSLLCAVFKIYFLKYISVYHLSMVKPLLMVEK